MQVECLNQLITPSRCGGAVVALLLLGTTGAGAQATPASADSAGKTRSDPVATLALWSDDVWLALLDRDGSYFGRLAEQGTFQRFNPLMDHEYELDVSTGLFTGSEDARWAPTRNGLRAAGASISHPLLLTVADWRHDLGIAGRVVLVPRFFRHHSLSTRRDYLSVGVEWRGIAGPHSALRGGLGVHAFKASGDLELALAHRRPAGRNGLTAELRLALLDAFTNTVFDLARGDPGQSPTHFHYRALPRAARLDLEWAFPTARVELHGGISSRSRVLVTFPVTGDTSFTQAEDVRYAGLLVEVTPSPRGALAVYATTARAATERRMESASPRDFDLLEETSSVGVRGRLRLARSLTVELDGRLVWRPERRVLGSGETIRHADREVFVQAVLVRRLTTGWLGRLGIAHLDRRAGILAPELQAANTRDLMEFGYRFRSGFEVAFGVRWDLDGAGTFDGGHLRLATTW